MLLTIDVGNTNTVLGVFGHDDLVAHWRISTLPERTADELGILLLSLLAMGEVDRRNITRACIACVVPSLLGPMEQACRQLLDIQPLVVRPGIRTGLPLLVENPQEIGADRIANSVGVCHRYGPPAIVVDFGTATTFDVITSRGEYAGGLISPGLRISADALFSRAARLPRIELTRPETLIGRNTIDSMRAGIFYGYLGLLDGILERLLDQITPPDSAAGESAIHVVATGGLAGEIAPHSRLIQHEDIHLTLYGLKVLDEKNATH
jgi:type III pantothenate kinase